MVALID